MKFKSLLVAAVAAVSLLAGCQTKEDPIEEAKLTVSPQTLSFEAAAGEKTVEVTSTREWKSQIKYEGGTEGWLSVSPEGGQGSSSAQTVTITAKANEGNDRKATVTFTIGLFKASVAVSQVGKGGPQPINDGSKEHPFLASEASAEAAKLASGEEAGPYYVKGFVKKFASKHEEGITEYGNALFYITDDKSGEGDDFYCYQVYYLGGKQFTSVDQIKVGDEVIVYGKITNYNGTYETVGKGAAFIYSLNGETGGDDPDPVEPITGDNLLTNGGFETWTGTKPDAWDFTSGNATLTKVGDAKEGANACEIGGDSAGKTNYRLMSKEYKLRPGTYQIQAYVKGEGQYRMGYAKLTDHKVADTSKDYIYIDSNPVQASSDWTLHFVQFKLEQETAVSVIVMNSKQGAGASVIVDDIKLVTKDGGLGKDDPAPVPGTPSGTGTEKDPFNATAAINAAVAAGETASTEFYYIKGFVSGTPSIDTGDYGNATFYITDAKGGNTIPFYCYQVMYIGGAKFTSTDQLKQGDEVVVYAQVVNYKGNTPETNGKGTGKIVSINGNSDAEDSFSVSPLSISASASSTTASFNVSANVSWTASCDNAAFTLGQTSGEGSATVSVTFEQNTGTEAKVANITVSTTADVATKSFTVVLTQKAPSTGSGYVKISSVDEVTDGAYVIVGSSNGKFFAMSNKNESNYATSYLNPKEIAVSGDAISTSDGDLYAVTITKKGTNYVLKGEKYISYTGKNDTYFVFSDTEPSDAWTLTLGDYGFIFTATNDTTRGLVYRFGTTHRFAPYKLTNVKGTEYTGVQLYKLQD